MNKVIFPSKLQRLQDKKIILESDQKIDLLENNLFLTTLEEKIGNLKSSVIQQSSSQVNILNFNNLTESNSTKILLSSVKDSLSYVESSLSDIIFCLKNIFTYDKLNLNSKKNIYFLEKLEKFNDYFAAKQHKLSNITENIEEVINYLRVVDKAVPNISLDFIKEFLENIKQIVQQKLLDVKTDIHHSSIHEERLNEQFVIIKNNIKNIFSYLPLYNF